MNPFDLGAEVFMVPALWGILLITVATLFIKAITRIKAEVSADGDLASAAIWYVDKKLIRKGVVTFILGGLVLSALVVTPPGHRAVIYTTSGVNLTERGEGYSLIVPILHNANMVNVREQVYENEEVYAQTSDLLEVTMKVAVNYLINPDLAADIFQSVGQNYEAAIIKPAVLDITKRQAGQIDAVDFAKEREKLAQAILSDLEARLAPLGITVTFVGITDAIFNTQFVQAVLNKEVADEKATESARLVVVAQNEAEQVRARAAGDADALVVIAGAEQQQIQLLGLTPTQYVWYKVWNGVLPTFMGGSDGQFIVDLPTTPPQATE